MDMTMTKDGEKTGKEQNVNRRPILDTTGLLDDDP